MGAGASAGLENTVKEATQDELNAFVKGMDAASLARLKEAMPKSGGGAKVLIGDYGGQVKLFDTSTGKLLKELKGHENDDKNCTIDACQLSPDGSSAVTACRSGAAKIWDLSAGTCTTTIEETGVHTACFSPDGALVAIGGNEGMVKICDAKTGEAKKCEGHKAGEEIVRVVFSPDGKLLLSCSDDKTAKLWDASSGELKKTLTGHEHQVKYGVFSPDGKLVLTATADPMETDQTARIWDVSSGDEKFKLDCKETLRDVAFSPDGKFAVTAGSSKSIRVWSVEDGKCTKTLDKDAGGHTNDVNFLNWSKDGSKLLSSGADGKAKIWDFKEGKCTTTLTVNPSEELDEGSPIKCALFTPDEASVFTTAYFPPPKGGHAKITDIKSGETKVLLDGSTNKVIFSVAMQTGQMAMLSHIA